MAKGNPSDKEVELVIDFFKTSSRLMIDKGSNHGAMTEVAKRHHVSKQRVDNALKEYNAWEEGTNPSTRFLKNAEILQDTYHQLQDRAKMFDHIEKRYEKFNKMIDDLEDYENQLRRNLEQLEITLDALTTAEKIDSKEKIDVLYKVIRGKNSPLGYKSLVSEVRGLLAEQRKEDSLANQIYDSINSGVKILAIIQKGVYDFDPSMLPPDRLDDLIKYVTRFMCPQCPGNEQRMAAIPDVDAYGDETVVNVEYEDDSDEEN